MAACASSRRVALWMTVSLLCVYTLAVGVDGYETVTALLFDTLSVDGFVAGLVYAKYLVGRDETSIMFAHDGTKDSSRAVKSMVEDKIKEHYLKVVYLGTSPLFKEDGYTEYGMIEDKLMKTFNTKPGLKSVEVFDNRVRSEITRSEWFRERKNFESHVGTDKSVSQQIVEMVEKNNEQIVAEYYKWLVQFAGFIEMDGSEEGKRMERQFSDRYRVVLKVDSKTSTILPYFLAPWFDGMFTKLRNDFVQHAVEGQWIVPSRRIEDAEAAVREFYDDEKKGLTASTASKFEEYCANFDEVKKLWEKNFKRFKFDRSWMFTPELVAKGLYVEIPGSVPTNLYMGSMMSAFFNVVIGKRQKTTGDGSVLSVWTGKDGQMEMEMNTKLAKCGGVLLEGRRCGFPEYEMDADAEAKFEKFLAENKD
eukprot:GHVS01065678.1.p1 GENE.GHVS01065678.1~~GHVS01065678.1.p1  ORF type:complete len:421 (-),score=46.72 GHVS01065678.1:94-1356(-)